MSISVIDQSCPSLRDPMDYNFPGSFVHGILQARLLEWMGDLLHPGIKSGSPAGRFFTV